LAVGNGVGEGVKQSQNKSALKHGSNLLYKRRNEELIFILVIIYMPEFIYLRLCRFI
jgi:hypothetical protein